MSLQQQIDQDIKKAMLAKDAVSLRGLRAIKAAILLARTEKGASEDISDEAEIKVLQKLSKQRKESAEIYSAHNRPDLHLVEMEELAVIEAYLPNQLSREAIVERITAIISETGAAGIRDMGKVMGAANKDLAGKADGRTISEVVKQLLS